MVGYLDWQLNMKSNENSRNSRAHSELSYHLIKVPCDGAGCRIERERERESVWRIRFESCISSVLSGPLMSFYSEPARRIYVQEVVTHFI